MPGMPHILRCVGSGGLWRWGGGLLPEEGVQPQNGPSRWNQWCFWRSEGLEQGCRSTAGSESPSWLYQRRGTRSLPEGSQCKELRPGRRRVGVRAVAVPMGHVDPPGGRRIGRAALCFPPALRARGSPGSGLTVMGISEGVPSARDIPEFRGWSWGQPWGQLGHGSHVCCGQMVAVFPRHQPIEAQRSAYHLGTAAGHGAVQLAAWDDQRARRVGAPWRCAGMAGARATPRPGISRGSGFPANCVYAINKYVYVYVCCYITILEQLGPPGSKHLCSAGERKGSKWCGNA